MKLGAGIVFQLGRCFLSAYQRYLQICGVISWWKIISITSTLFVSCCYYFPSSPWFLSSTPHGSPTKQIFVFTYFKERKCFLGELGRRQAASNISFSPVYWCCLFCSAQCLLQSLPLCLWGEHAIVQQVGFETQGSYKEKIFSLYSIDSFHRVL